MRSLPAKTSRTDDSAFVLHVFRVSEGLGNACLIELPDATCSIVDWGTQDPDTLAAVLEIIGERKLRFVAASHAHADHTLGLPGLLRACTGNGVEIERLVYPASSLHREASFLTRTRLVARDRRIPMSAIAVQDLSSPLGPPKPPHLAWGKGWEVRVLGPSSTRVGSSETRSLEQGVVPGNETSLVVLFRFTGDPEEPGIGRALLPGDATPATLQFARQTAASFPGLELDNQAFVVPHHGSSSNLPRWLEAHIHGVAVVSAPTDSRHHPAADVLLRLSRRTCSGETPRLFCTSYAGCCAERHGLPTEPSHRLLIQPGSCFGDVQVRVPRSQSATVVAATADGTARRPFGCCGNV